MQKLKKILENVYLSKQMSVVKRKLNKVIFVETFHALERSFINVVTKIIENESQIAKFQKYYHML